jgi:fructan beta-fructosidase
VGRRSNQKNGSGRKSCHLPALIYTSPNLKEWTYQSGVTGFFECPELFELAVENESGVSKWVMFDATGRYVVGDFDGKNFTIEQAFRQYDHGGHFYASQTYNNVPDDRRIQIGWGRGINMEGMPFNQSMTFPAELRLKNTFDGLRLCPRPVKEIESLYAESYLYENKIMRREEPFTARVSGDALHIVAALEKGDAHEFGLRINGYELAFNSLHGSFNKTNYPNANSEYLKIEAIVDKAMLEVFVNEGELYYVASLNPTESDNKIEAFVKGPAETKSMLKSLEIHELKAVWEEQLPIRQANRK